MPIYEYECKKCGLHFDVMQSFSDDPVKTCQGNGCRGRVRKVFSPPTIIFKGSGFYTTDYANGKSPDLKSEEKKDTKEKEPVAAGSSKSSSDKSDSKD